ncbi:MAG: argininosuccinate lyase [Oscillospiraceae bacterium]|nr:argininosuccinate lyase [Oscillospiraceae bacterium]
MSIREKIVMQDGAVFPAKAFADAVLEPVFDTQRDYYYQHFLEISLAHAVMLHEQGILEREETRIILRGLLEIREIDFSNAKYNPAYEDMFFTLEKDLERRIGAIPAGRLHIARSRNDVGICQYRMALRLQLLAALCAVRRLTETLIEVAGEHVETVMPAYTHTQPAQPTTFAHYLLAFCDSLIRGWERLFGAYGSVNRSTLGAAAITTTGFPINRERMSELLGFDGLVENSYDAIACVEYITHTASALTELGVSLSRFLKDTLDFCTREYGYFRLADPYVQISSIMPQKRNPSSLEHARPITSALIGQAQTAVMMLHNTPFGDMVDSEEQLQPHLYASIENLMRVLTLLTNNYATMEVNKDIMRKRAGEGFITATELADTLVRDGGLSFRESHRITAAIVRTMYEKGLTQSELTPDIIREIAGGGAEVNRAMIETALNPAHFISIRGITGGPAPDEVRRMLTDRQSSCAALALHIDELRKHLADAHQLLEVSVQRITET